MNGKRKVSVEENKVYYKEANGNPRAEKCTWKFFGVWRCLSRRTCISSRKSTKITISCWTTFHRRILESTKKQHPTSKHKGRKVIVAQSSPTPCNLMDYIVHGILQARVLEWGAFPFSRGLPNPGIKPRSPALQVDSFQLSHRGSPRILEWVAYPFSRRSSWPRNQTGAFCIAGGFFTSWIIREAWRRSCLVGNHQTGEQ